MSNPGLREKVKYLLLIPTILSLYEMTSSANIFTLLLLRTQGAFQTLSAVKKSTPAPSSLQRSTMYVHILLQKRNTFIEVSKIPPSEIQASKRLSPQGGHYKEYHLLEYVFVPSGGNLKMPRRNLLSPFSR